MNLTRPTNNLVSNLAHAAVGGMPAIEAGDGVTVLMWSDRTVGTVVEVISEVEVIFTEDTTRAAQKDLPLGHQNWVHAFNPNGRKIRAKRGRDGRWYIARRTPTGRWSVNKRCTPLAMKRRDYHYDWSL